MQIVGERRVSLRRTPIPLAKEQRVSGIDVQAAAFAPRALSPLEQPEADPERETIDKSELSQFVGTGDLEDLVVLDIGRMGDAAMQRGVDDDSLEVNW